MSLQLSVAALALVLFGAFGLPVAALLRRHSAGILLAIPAFGIALLASLAALLYGVGLSGHVIGIAALCAAPLLLILFRRLAFAVAAGAARHPAAALLLALFAGILLSPILYGNFDLTVFQSNWHDGLSYLSGAVVYAKLPIAAVAQAGEADFRQNPLLAIAQHMLGDRPAVAILFGAIAGLIPGGIGTGSYGFLAGLMIAGMLAFAGLLIELFGAGRGRLVAALASGAYACGFWGQYSADIDAWSAVSFMPVLLALWLLVLPLLAGAPYWRPGLIAALGLLMAGSLYLYPEGTGFHALILASVVALAWAEDGLALLLGRWRSRPTPSGRPLTASLVLAAAAALALILMLPGWHGTMDLLGRHAGKAMAVPVDWWTGFDAYLFGTDPALNKALIADAQAALRPGQPAGLIVPRSTAGLLTGLSGVLGVYFLTPSHADAIAGLDAAKAVLLLAVFLGAALGVGLGLASRDRAYRLLLGAVAAGLVGAALLVEQRQAWAAGKALSYMAPLLCLALVAPAMLAFGARHRLQRRALAAAPVAWGMAQACFVGFILLRLASHETVRLPEPYPGWENRSLKAERRWDVDGNIARLRQCPAIQIQAPDQPFRDYAAIHLYEQGLRYFYPEPDNLYLDGTHKTVAMAAIDIPPKCRLVEPASAGTRTAAPPPPGVPSFPAGLGAPGLFFAGVTAEGWLGPHANTRLALAGGSNQLHLSGEVPASSAGTRLSITVDGAVVLEQALAAGPLDLAIALPPGTGTRNIAIDLTGLPPDAPSQPMRLTAITLENA